MTFSAYLRSFLLCALLALCCAVAWRLYRAVEATEALIAQATVTLQDGQTALAGSLSKLDLAVDAWQQSSRKSLAYTDLILVNTRHTITEVNRLVSDLRAATKRTDENINGVLLPNIGQLVANTDASLNSKLLPVVIQSTGELSGNLKIVTAGLETVMSGGSETLAELRKSIISADGLLTDPNLKATLVNVEAGTRSGAAAVENVNRWTARMLAPAHKVRDFFINLGGAAYRIFLKP